MQRRKFLATTMLAALAGCSSSDTEEMDTPEDTEDEDTQGDTAADNEDTTEADEEESGAGGEPALEILDSELVVEEGEYSTDVYVAATVENTGDAPSGTTEIVADWYDADDNYMDDSSAYLQSLGAGETWAARIYFLGTGAEEVDDYEVSGEFDTDPQTFDPEGLDLVEHNMQVGEDEAVIEGQVENGTGEEASYIQAIGKVYDADGIVLGDDWTNVSDVPDGETWAFEVSWRGRDRTEQADDYEVLITDSSF